MAATKNTTKIFGSSTIPYDSQNFTQEDFIETNSAGANIFAFQHMTVKANVTLRGQSGDVVYIEGTLGDYQVKQNVKNITFGNPDSPGYVKINLASLSANKTTGTVSVKVILLDGSVTLTNKAGSTKVFLNGVDDTGTNTVSQPLTKKYAVVDGKLNPVEDGTALNYFSGLPVNDVTTVALTTGIDIATANLFDGSFNAAGYQTLNSGDQLTGKALTGNVLDAQIYSSVTPAYLTNIQTVEVTATHSLHNVIGDILAQATPLTVGLINATGTTTLVNDRSARDLTFTNVAASANNVTVQNTSSDTEVVYTSTTGDQTVNLTVSNVGASAQSAIIIDGVETINIVSSGAANDVLLDGDAIETINVSGDQDLGLDIDGLTENVSNVNASALTGDLYLVMQAQTGVLDSTVITVTSGQGDDNINLTNVTQLLNVTLGDGDDFLEDDAFTVNDTVDGGLGFDALETTYDTAVDLGAATNNVNGIEELELSDALDGNLNLTKIDSTITELELSGETGVALITSDANVTGAAGTLTVDLGDDLYNGSSLVLAADLTVTDTGTAITDAVVFNNFVTDGSGTNLDVFAFNDITSTGYENVTINTGAASNAVSSITGGQTIGDLTITADAATAPVSLVATGTNSLNIEGLYTNSTGLTTVNASGLNVLAIQAGLTLTGTTLGALGTQSILGSAGMDTIDVGNFASTIDGGAGNDQIVGGTLADVIDGGTGNDTIASGGGNDVIRGGAGNDAIATISIIDLTTTPPTFSPAAGNVTIDGGEGNDTVALFNTLTEKDSVDGGTGVDTLYLRDAAATGTTGVGIKNFEVLATNVSQTMSNFVNNTGWTTVSVNGQNLTIDNVSATLNTVKVNDLADNGTVTFDRLTDTGTDSLTFVAGGSRGAFGLSPLFDGTITTLTVNDEESLTIDVSNSASSVGGSLTIDNLVAADLTSLTLTGDHAVTINNIAQQTSLLTTINATGITAGSVSVNAQSITAGITATGSATVANILTTGSGADSITGGSANDHLTGYHGADTLIGAGGNDILLGGGGADSINAGTGFDTITGGFQADTVTLTVDGQTDTINQGICDSVAATATTSQAPTFAIGDTITFGNGVDVINNFLAGAGAGADLLVVGTTVDTSVLGASTSTTTVGWLSGTYLGNVFTVTANGVGPDTLVLQASTLSGLSRAVVLVGVDSDNLVDGNFVGATYADIIPLYNAGDFTFTAGSVASQHLNMAADGTFTDDMGAQPANVIPNPATGFSQAGLTSLDLSNLTGGFGVAVNLDGTVSTALYEVIGTTGDDNFIFANENFGNNAFGVYVEGKSGIDTITLTNVETSTLANLGSVYHIDNLLLTNGTENSALTLTSVLTLSNGGPLAVVNESATADATVVLNTNAHTTYESASTGADTLSLSNPGQSVTLTNGGINDVIANSVAGATVSTDATLLTVSNLTSLSSDFCTSEAVFTSFLSVGPALFTPALPVTLGSITGFDVLTLADQGMVPTTTVIYSGATNSITQLAVDTSFSGLSYNASVAQLNAMTSATNVVSPFAFDLKATAAAGGTLDLAGMTLTNVAALDLDFATSAVTVTGTAALVDSFATIAGVGAGGTTTLTSTDNAVLNLGTGTFTLIDTLNFAGAGANTLTVQFDDLNATNFTTINGVVAGTSQLAVTVGSVDLTNTTVSYFDTITFDGANATISLDAASLVGTVTLANANFATANLALTETGNYTNVSLTASDFDSILLSDGVTATMSSNVLVAGVASILGDAGVLLAESAVINAATATAAVNMSSVLAVTNLSSLTVHDGIGANTITTSGVDAVRGLTDISLANGGTDIVELANAAFANNALHATITSFAADDVIKTSVGPTFRATQTSNGLFFDSSAGPQALTVGQVEEVLSSTFTIVDFTNTAAVLAVLTAAGVTSGAWNAGSTIIVYDGLGMAGIYQVNNMVAAAGNFTDIELVGTVNATADSLVAANFG